MPPNGCAPVGGLSTRKTTFDDGIAVGVALMFHEADGWPFQ
jgi:hypothetical protein